VSEFPAGWYDDGKGSTRWWDGTRWTEHVQPAPPAAPSYATAQPYPAVPGPGAAASQGSFSGQGPASDTANPFADRAAAQHAAAPSYGQVPAPAPGALVGAAQPAFGAPAYDQPAGAFGAQPLGYPPFQAPPATQPDKRASKKLVGWIVGGGVAFLAIVVALVVVLVPNLTDGGSPRSTVSAFASRVLMAESCTDDVVDAFNTLTSSTYRQGTTATCDTIGTFSTNPPGYSVTAGKVLTETSSKATVQLTIKNSTDGSDGTYVVSLVKEDGSWKVSSLGAGSDQSGTDTTSSTGGSGAV